MVVNLDATLPVDLAFATATYGRASQDEEVTGQGNDAVRTLQR